MTLSVESFVGKKLDHFILDEFIANGAMGMVFKATDMILNRTVAIKLIATTEVLDSRTLTEAKKRLLAEARAAGRLSHPNVVGIYSYGEADGLQYICMEYVNGRTLSELLSEKKVLDLEMAVSIIERVLEALEAANRENIVHRDIKPSNIMITPEGAVKVMDFGIAKLPSLSMTVTGAVLGTPFYMSPEQITGQKVDIRSDLFAVGVVFYQMLTGARAFEGEGTASLAYKIVNVDPIPPNVLNTQVPPRLVGIIGKALAKDPALRYQNPGEMLADVRRIQTEADGSSKAIETEATVICVTPAAETPVAAAVEAVTRSKERTAGPVSGPMSGQEAPIERDRTAVTPAFRAEGEADAVAAETVIGTPEEGTGLRKETPGPVASKAPVRQESYEEPRPVVQPDIPPKREPARTAKKGAGAPRSEPPRVSPEGEKKPGSGRMLAIGAVLLIFCILGIYAALRMFQKPVREDVASLGPPGLVSQSGGAGQTQEGGATQGTPSVKTPESTSPAVSSPAQSDGTTAPSASALVAQAKGQMAGNPAGARQLAEEAVRLDPGNLEGILLLAGILADSNEFARAIQYYRQAVQIDGRSADIRFALGSAYMLQGSYDEAVASFEAGLGLSADNRDDVLTSLGVCYLKKGSTAMALSSFQRAVAVNPSNAEAQRYIESLSAASVQPSTVPASTAPASSTTAGVTPQGSYDAANAQKAPSPSVSLPTGPTGGESSGSPSAGSVPVESTMTPDQAKPVQRMQTRTGLKQTEEVSIDLGGGQGSPSGSDSAAGRPATGQ